VATTLNWIGLACELVGLGIALWGLDELSSELFPTSPLPHKAAGRWVKRRVGFKPHTRAHAGVATAFGAAATLAARGTVTKGRPSDAAPHSQWTAYWDSRLEALSDQMTWLKEDMEKGDRGLAEKLSTEQTERHEAIVQLQERLRVVVGGEGGRGLRRTWWGLAVTALGVLLQGVS
jgi:hypothetical protein